MINSEPFDEYYHSDNAERLATRLYKHKVTMATLCFRKLMNSLDEENRWQGSWEFKTHS